MKKFSFVLALLVVFATVLAACGGAKVEPQQAILDSITKSKDMKTYNFEGNIKFALKSDDPNLDPEVGMMLQFFEDFNIKYTGTYQKDPAKVEVVLETSLNLGDLNTKIEIPILMDEQNMWIYVPNIPGLPLEGLSGKYIHANFEELAALSGQDISSMMVTSDEDMDAFIKVAELFINSLNKDYFTIEKKDGVNVVTFDFAGDRLYSMIDSLVKDFIPQFADLVEKNDYYSVFNITEADVAEMKKITTDNAEYQQGMEEIKKVLKVNKGVVIQEINKDGFMSGYNMATDLTINDPEMGMTLDLGIVLDQKVTNINKAVEFKVAEPAQDETISIQELAPYIFGLMMGGY